MLKMPQRFNPTTFSSQNKEYMFLFSAAGVCKIKLISGQSLVSDIFYSCLINKKMMNKHIKVYVVLKLS